MAIDTETRRASVLHSGSFFPGKLVMQSEPDGSDLDGFDERQFVLWVYAGIDTSLVITLAGGGLSALTALSGLSSLTGE